MLKSFADASYQAFFLLRITFIIAPILAGLDKFFYLLTNWSNYIAPFVLKMIHGHDRGFMAIVGVIEIIAGLGVVFKPKLFSYIVSLLLFGIVINLHFSGQYFLIALRDLGLCLSALALGRLSQEERV
jgi:hypothetical protein